MKGLELCRGYFESVCRARIEQRFPDKFGRMAFGLVGEGSECYGFDDEISRDHDFGPRFMVWLTDEDDADFGAALADFLETLPRAYGGYDGVNQSAYGGGRAGVFTVSRFYLQHIGLGEIPRTVGQWRALQEVPLSSATNGEVWLDPVGAFSAFRTELLLGYPPDILLKKMAARCMTAAQAGQYNFARCLRRGERVAARLAQAEFIESAGSLIFLLNNRYRPFYKWMPRALRALPVLGAETGELFLRLADAPLDEGEALIERICALIIAELRRRGLSDSDSDFLLDHGPCIQSHIRHEGLRSLPVFAE